MVGAADGFPGDTVGPVVVGALDVGLAVVGVVDGLPGVTVGPTVVGASLVGLPVVGVADGFPGATVGPAVVGGTLEGHADVGAVVVGKADGFPGATVGPAVVGLTVVGVPDGFPGDSVGPAVAALTMGATALGWLVAAGAFVAATTAEGGFVPRKSLSRSGIGSAAARESGRKISGASAALGRFTDSRGSNTAALFS